MNDDTQYPEGLTDLLDLIFDPTADAGIQLVKKLEPVFREAERWRWVQSAKGGDLTWASQRDGTVKWVFHVTMPDPDISEAALTETSVRDELAAAIDAAMARARGTGAA